MNARQHWRRTWRALRDPSVGGFNAPYVNDAIEKALNIALASRQGDRFSMLARHSSLWNWMDKYRKGTAPRDFRREKVQLMRDRCSFY